MVAVTLRGAPACCWLGVGRGGSVVVGGSACGDAVVVGGKLMSFPHCWASVAAVDANASPRSACNNASWAVAGM